MLYEIDSCLITKCKLLKMRFQLNFTIYLLRLVFNVRMNPKLSYKS